MAARLENEHIVDINSQEGVLKDEATELLMNIIQISTYAESALGVCDAITCVGPQVLE